jgi:hypothetical protein
MQEMQDRCESVQAEMDKTNEGTKGLVARANGLREQQSVRFYPFSAICTDPGG